MTPSEPAPPVPAPAAQSGQLDTTEVSVARRYGYWLGGKDHFAADRESGDAIATQFPTIRHAAVANRHFMHRAVRFLAGEAGVRQFLDIGTGLPVEPNVHDLAQDIAADSRVVYVDRDPMVVSHLRARTISSPHGATACIEADLRNPDSFLAHPTLHDTLDLRQPVGVLLIAVAHFLADEDHPYAVVRRLLNSMPPGSFLALSHATYDLLPDDVANRMRVLLGTGTGHGTFAPRTRGHVARFFTGLDLVDPGLVSITDWRPDPGAENTSAADTSVYGAVARLP